jgi:hypothetical protein
VSSRNPINNSFLRHQEHLPLNPLPPRHQLTHAIVLRLQREEKTYLERSICPRVRLVQLLGTRKLGIMAIGELSFALPWTYLISDRFIPTRENSAHAAFQLLPEHADRNGNVNGGRKASHGQGTDADARRGG